MRRARWTKHLYFARGPVMSIRTKKIRPAYCIPLFKIEMQWTGQTGQTRRARLQARSPKKIRPAYCISIFFSSVVQIFPDEPGTVFTTFHFLCNLRIGPISWTVS